MPYSSGHASLGVIDIGSNSVRMVIYDLAHNPPVKIFNEKVICPLGKDLGTTGHLNAEAASSAFKALQAYKLLSEVYHVAALHVVGTAALRDAVDGADFIARVASEIGLTIRIITGDQEATYAARGVLMFDPAADGVVADFGGGSLELARVQTDDVSDTISLPMGAYRVQAMGDQADTMIQGLLDPVVPRFGRCEALYAIGGSWRVLASAYMKEQGKKYDLQGYKVPAADMVMFCQKIAGMSDAQLRKTYRMETHQSKLAAVAARTLAAVLTHLAPHSFVVSTAGVRDGVVHEFLLSFLKTQ